LQTQQELCAKRFLRFASLHHVHGIVALWAAALWFAGIHLFLACAPVLYFTGVVALARRSLLTSTLEHLSFFILVLNVLNAVHLATLCGLQGDQILTSPLFAFVPLSRLMFGIFTREVHCHLGLSSLVALLIISCNSRLVVGGETLLVVLTLLLFELTTVVVLAEGPCGYEEAIMHLAQCRTQHQLERSQAVQRIDVEREEFSGQLLAIATQGIAELSAAVQQASEPVLGMLKSSCATGTKSAAEAERIGLIGEALKEDVSQILRYKTQAVWARLKERAMGRTGQLRAYAATQQAASDSLLRYLHQHMGRSLAQMHELELEAETSLEQLIQGEVNRAMETADARMDLVRQSSQAMERRVSDTVEVLLSLLKYFRSKGESKVPRDMSAAAPKRAIRDGAARHGGRHIELDGRRLQVLTRSLPAIHERTSVGDQGQCQDVQGSVQPTDRTSPKLSALARSKESSTALSSDTFAEFQTGEHSSNIGSTMASDASASSVDGIDISASSTCSGTAIEIASNGLGSESLSDDGSSVEQITPTSQALERTGCNTNSLNGWPSSETNAAQQETSSDGSVLESAKEVVASQRCTENTGRSAQASSGLGRAIDRHPLFASRLCYQTDDFFWSWASSRDFRAESDALRQWQRASRCSTDPRTGASAGRADTGGSFTLATDSGIHGAVAEAAVVSLVDPPRPPGPTGVFIDLSGIKLPSVNEEKAVTAYDRTPTGSEDEGVPDAYHGLHQGWDYGMEHNAKLGVCFWG